jgi:predicted dehydrogenase
MLVKVAIVGTGYIANRVHLPIFRKMKEARVVAVCDADEDRARRTAHHCQISKFYTDFEKMLAQESVDIVDICTPSPTHASLTLQALRAGFNCLVEKPLALRVDEADEVIEVANSLGLKVHVIHNYSFTPGMLKAKRMVASGVIGEVIGMDVNYLAPVDDRHLNANHWLHRIPGGVLAEVTPHLAMLFVEFLGDITEVKVAGAKKSPYPYVSLDELRVIVEARNGLGVLNFSHNCPSRRFTLDIIGTAGSLYVDGDAQSVVKYSSHPGSEAIFFRGSRAISEIVQKLTDLSWVAINVVIGRYTALTQGHRYLIHRSVQSLQGKETYPVELSQAREAVKLTQTIFAQLKPVPTEDQF